MPKLLQVLSTSRPALVLVCVLSLEAYANEIPRELPDPSRQPVLQPIHEYFYPSVPYTHLGTDFGPIGDADELRWQDGRIVATSTDMLGMWHCLSGRSEEASRVLDFSACFPKLIVPRFQPAVRGLVIQCQLSGRGSLEIKSSDHRILWKKSFQGQDSRLQRREFDVPASQIREAKYVNWVASGPRVEVDSVGLLIEPPRASYRTLVFLYSYAKLARCYDEKLGLVRDRAHSAAGTFDCIPTTGMFALATAVAARVGIVERTAAEEVAQRVHDRISKIPRARGWLPHFVQSSAGAVKIAPGTEFSTVDSSLYYHAMLLASQLLENAALQRQLETEIQRLDVAFLTHANGSISHGIRDDGVSRLPSRWEDWGGESALVMMLGRMANPTDEAFVMRSPGEVYNGVGFIAEIQSLFYPQFSQKRADRQGVHWLKARQRLLARQRRYFARDVPCAELGIYGLSAGEAAEGDGYAVNGVNTEGAKLIHPHYMLMSGALRGEPIYESLLELQQRGMFPPWGLAENVHPQLTRYLAYHGSLNASFECLSAYHLAASSSGKKDLIYSAARSCAFTRRAANLLFAANSD